MNEDLTRIMRELEDELCGYATRDMALYDRDTGQVIPIPFEFVTGLYMMAVSVGVLTTATQDDLADVSGRDFLGKMLDNYGYAKVAVGHVEEFK